MLGGDDAGGSGTVVDHDRGPQLAGHGRRHEPRDDVRRASGAEGHDQANGFLR